MRPAKDFFLCLLILSAALSLSAQAPEWLWAESAGGTEYDMGWGISLDASGNSYVTGWFTDSVSFGSTTLTSAGTSDIFVAKMDPDGNWLWAKRAGGMLPDFGYCIATDSAGNSYVTGSFMFNADFGATNLTSNQMSHDAFIARLDADGNWLWAVRAGGTGLDCGNGIALDADGSCLVTGYFSETADFGTFSLSSAGNRDVFITKLSTQGTWLWAERAGGPGDDLGNGICAGPGDSCFVTGSFSETAYFGSLNLTSAGGVSDIFIARLSSGWDWYWAKKAGGTNTVVTGDSGYGISSDAAGNCYVTGEFSVSGWFGDEELIGTGNSINIFVSKLDPNGNWLWAVTPGGTHDGDGFGICTDDFGNSYVTGAYGGEAQFGDTSIVHSGSTDVFVALLNSGGNWLWAVSAGGPSSEWGQTIAVDSGGTSRITGHFMGSPDFGSTTLSSNGEGDVFVACLDSGPVATDDGLAPGLVGNSVLYDACPNPFHRWETAGIKTDIAAGETGRLDIFNLRGQLVGRHILPSGSHEVSLKGKDLSAGIYLYRLQTQTTELAKKLILLP